MTLATEEHVPTRVTPHGFRECACCDRPGSHNAEGWEQRAPDLHVCPECVEAGCVGRVVRSYHRPAVERRIAITTLRLVEAA